MFARCMNHNKTVSNNNSAATLGKAEIPECEWCKRARDESREGGIAGGRSNDQPHDAEEQCRRPMESDKQANKSGDPFAAFEFEPHRKEMAEERAKCGRKRWISDRNAPRRGQRWCL